jgi:hypothetical protein
VAEDHEQAHRRLEDWIGERVTVNLLRGPHAPSDDAIVAVVGALEGVDPMGIILLYSPHDVSTKRGRAQPPADMPPRRAFFPWRRIELIERGEIEDAWPDFYSPTS